MELIFGKGDILVTECGNTETRHILIETGRGNGTVGSLNTQHPDRQEGAIIPQEDFENATCTLTFDNPVSLGVVLEKALVGMVAFRKAGRTIGEEASDLGQSIRELCQELLGLKDDDTSSETEYQKWWDTKPEKAYPLYHSCKIAFQSGWFIRGVVDMPKPISLKDKFTMGLQCQVARINELEEQLKDNHDRAEKIIAAREKHIKRLQDEIKGKGEVTT